LRVGVNGWRVVAMQHAVDIDADMESGVHGVFVVER
jgi:hypothetical protein